MPLFGRPRCSLGNKPRRRHFLVGARIDRGRPQASIRAFPLRLVRSSRAMIETPVIERSTVPSSKATDIVGAK
jgi:hypothetical protein